MKGLISAGDVALCLISWHCFCLQNIIKFVRLLLACCEHYGLKGTCLEYTPNKIEF